MERESRGKNSRKRKKNWETAQVRKDQKANECGFIHIWMFKKGATSASQYHLYESKLRVLSDKTFCIHAFKKIKSYPTPNFKLRLLFYLWVLWGHRRISNWLNIVHWRFYFADKYLMINWCKLFNSLAPPPLFNEGAIVRSGTLFRWKAISCTQFDKLGSILCLLL